MKIEFFWQNGGLLKRMSGALSEAEFLRSAEQTLNDPRFDDAEFVINDFQKVTGHAFSRGMLPYLATLQYGAKATNARCRIVFVSRNQTLLDLIKDTLATRDLDHFEVGIAASMQEARDWLKCAAVAA